MNIQTQKKHETVADLKQVLENVASIIVAKFEGVNVDQVNSLRHEIHKAGCTYRVVKNTLFKRAIIGTPYETLGSLFKGTTAIAFSPNDPVAPAKVLDKFADQLEKLDIKGGFLDGKVLSKGEVKNLASMKGKDELRAELLATMQAPMQEFMRLLNAAPQNFMYLLAAREKELG